MIDQVIVTYRHSCGCSLNGTPVEYRPEVVDGVVFLGRPVCAQTGLELELVHWSSRDQLRPL